jgi:hypothetical protein
MKTRDSKILAAAALDALCKFPLLISFGGDISWFFSFSVFLCLILKHGAIVFDEMKPPTPHKVRPACRTCRSDHTSGR